mmetsp:Transcript_17252/g.44062  ORF Transcript_17252/g.44062 Transcript_17252/m.44062 type:complete len:221 (-) Transcript_17252:776-1438(-)
MIEETSRSETLQVCLERFVDLLGHDAARNFFRKVRNHERNLHRHSTLALGPLVQKAHRAPVLEAREALPLDDDAFLDNHILRFPRHVDSSRCEFPRRDRHVLLVDDNGVQPWRPRGHRLEIRKEGVRKCPGDFYDGIYISLEPGSTRWGGGWNSNRTASCGKQKLTGGEVDVKDARVERLIIGRPEGPEWRNASMMMTLQDGPQADGEGRGATCCSVEDF